MENVLHKEASGAQDVCDRLLRNRSRRDSALDLLLQQQEGNVKSIGELPKYMRPAARQAGKVVVQEKRALPAWWRDLNEDDEPTQSNISTVYSQAWDELRGNWDELGVKVEGIARNDDEPSELATFLSSSLGWGGLNLVDACIYITPTNDIRGFSFANKPGAIFVKPEADPEETADHIFHESLHVYIDELHREEPLWVESRRKFKSPWRTDSLRPIQGLFHGVYTFGMVMMAQARTDTWPYASDIEGAMQKVRDAFITLNGEARECLTRRGAEFMAYTERTISAETR